MSTGFKIGLGFAGVIVAFTAIQFVRARVKAKDWQKKSANEANKRGVSSISAKITGCFPFNGQIGGHVRSAQEGGVPSI